LRSIRLWEEERVDVPGLREDLRTTPREQEWRALTLRNKSTDRTKVLFCEAFSDSAETRHLGE
jgi:hypothetical protein